ncbi:related to poly(A)-specific ribonuclease [Phialocephala subalpina]|uniref:PAN2-PAN3 deadenylation complex subunit PAN3 n=1 Tax=Phialocephala subalpina TaxID=576137 RepID=A0A1L7WF49_9HELO|nr:related to poly(A)-specific ribonuclease [Phialocephala subalpina]
MATRFGQPELRKPAGSPKPRGKENQKDTLCRNVVIYGHCRYEDQGCAFNHDPNKTLSSQAEAHKWISLARPQYHRLYLLLSYHFNQFYLPRLLASVSNNNMASEDTAPEDETGSSQPQMLDNAPFPWMPDRWACWERDPRLSDSQNEDLIEKRLARREEAFTRIGQGMPPPSFDDLFDMEIYMAGIENLHRHGTTLDPPATQGLPQSFRQGKPATGDGTPRSICGTQQYGSSAIGSAIIISPLFMGSMSIPLVAGTSTRCPWTSLLSRRLVSLTDCPNGISVPRKFPYHLTTKTPQMFSKLRKICLETGPTTLLPCYTHHSRTPTAVISDMDRLLSRKTLVVAKPKTTALNGSITVFVESSTARTGTRCRWINQLRSYWVSATGSPTGIKSKQLISRSKSPRAQGSPVTNPTTNLRTLSKFSPANNTSGSKKLLNVDSPSFTPGTLATSGKISSHAANALPFQPRGLVSGTVTPTPQPEPQSSVFNMAEVKEFTPGAYDPSQTLGVNGSTTDQVSYDPFSMQSLNQTIPTGAYNPYLEDTTMQTNAAGYFQAPTTFNAPAQPLQYHLYAPIGPHKEDILAYQRLAHDFFLPNDLREELQKKSEATRQVMLTHQLPNVEPYHSLVPLDTNHHKNATIFGFPSWVYKAISSKNGCYCVLRRIEGFRLSNERAIQQVKTWKRAIDNAGIVSVVDCFTTRAFGDSSLIFVYDYHPMSKTLVEQHAPTTNRYGNRSAHTPIQEHVLWGYIVQIASAIRAVHEAKLAVRCMDPSKVLVTETNRIRLGACGILDVTKFETDQRNMADVQQEDFILFGRLILALASNNMGIASNNLPVKSHLDHLNRAYSIEFKDTLTWLLTPATPPDPKNFNEFLRGISGHVMSSFSNSLHANDTLTSQLTRELENGRLFRLMAKLGEINERPEYDNNPKWSETGERYMLKLFRDYVFHQVNAEGKPHVNMGHVLECLNKLDAGSNQTIKLISRDEQDCFIVSYKELKKQVEAAFQELIKPESTKRY